jgi:acetyl/propionyl-CoA carboxylase alpha subunit
LAHALSHTVIFGVETNTGFLRRLACDSEVRAGRMHTGLIAAKLAALTAPQSDARTHAVMAAAALSSLRELRAEVDRTPPVHAAIGGWTN